MNVKNKVISVVMSFIIVIGSCFSSFANDKESIGRIAPLVVDGGIISAPMLATVSTLAVATGIALNNEEDIYKIGRYFYEQNKKNWSTVCAAFNGAVQLGQANRKILVKKGFLDLVKTTFSNVDKSAYTQDGQLLCYSGLKTMEGINFNGLSSEVTFKFNDSYEIVLKPSSWNPSNTRITAPMQIKRLTNVSGPALLHANTSSVRPTAPIILVNNGYYLTVDTTIPGTKYNVNMKDIVESWGHDMSVFDSISLPYAPGSYNDSIYKDKDEIGIYVPSNLGDLVNGNVKSDDIVSDSLPSWNVTDKTVSLPNVLNPSIGVTDGAFTTDSPVTDAPGADAPGIVFPPFGGGLDFTPITQSSFTDKFPFSLASDIKNIISVFNVEPNAPKFTVPLISEELEIDLTQFNIWAGIIRFFVLIGFMISLINITRKVIG